MKWDEVKKLEEIKKKKSGVLNILMKANTSLLWLGLLVPFMSLCNLCSPIALNAVTKFLVPGSFYDCD